MSSNEDEPNEGESVAGQGSKKRRIQRACDICRRKKIRCDGVQMPGNRCSNCISYSFECTYVEAAKKRGPPKSYVESLENRLEKTEKLLRRLLPDSDLTKELGSGNNRERPPPRADKPKISAGKSPTEIATNVIRGVGNHMKADTSLSVPDDDFVHITLAENLRLLSLDPSSYRFFGKSSSAMLIQTAIDIKDEFTGAEPRGMQLGARRPEFWAPMAWETTETGERPNYVFPENDLMLSLIDLYFDNLNLYFPLLHRPTFERSVAECLHHTNESFAATLLLVCAVGSRYSDDPRVLLDDEASLHSCGWKYFDQVHVVRKSLLTPPSIYDLQFYCLSVQFLQGTSAPQACWTMVGIGIRLAQDVGAHRRKQLSHRTTVEDEMWKRAFWVLVFMDRTVSAALGRPCAIQDEDFDVDFPIDCDDEYWEHPDPEQAFKQPPNKPSRVACFISYLRLNQILAFALRTIYSINKSKILLGFIGQEWEQHIVAELDSALNKWVDSIPDHLRWDPNRENEDFFNQSVSLYTSYYHLQILIHRPFIPSPRKPSPLSFPSLAICTNAARSCSHVVDIKRKRSKKEIPHILMAVFTAGIVLLLNIWGGKRSGLSTDPNKEMADVHKCMQVLQACESRWHSTGRLWDILYELASVGQLALPKSSPPPSNKRERGSDNPVSPSSQECSSARTPESTDPAHRAIAGTRRLQTMDIGTMPAQSVPQRSYHQSQSQEAQPHPDAALQQPQSSSSQSLFSLPLYSDELGRLPLHGQFQIYGPRPPPPTDQQNNNNSALWPPDWNHSAAAAAGPSASAAPAHAPGFAMEESFYDHLATNFPDSFLQQASAAAAASEYRNGPGMGGEGEMSHMVHDARAEGQQQEDHGSAQPLLDNDTIAMWSTAPTGFELDDWGTYLSNVSEITQSMHVAS